MSIQVHCSGSWYRQGECKSLIEHINAQPGCTVLVDWTTEEHQTKPKAAQWHAIVDAIKAADVVFLSFEGMEDRTESATFAQFFQATGFGKRVIVYDPAKAGGARADEHGRHPAFMHLMGCPLKLAEDFPNVTWTASFDEATAELTKVVPDDGEPAWGCSLN